MNKPKVPALFLALAISNSPAIEADNAKFPRAQGSQGCLIEQITDGPFNQYQFQGVSRDGHWLAYSISEGDDGPKYSVLMDLRSGEIEKLDSTINNTGHLSLENKTLVSAVSDEEGITEIVELDLASQTTRVIASDPAYDWLPSYSPDQKSIVFNSYRNGNSDIYLFDRKTEELLQFTDDPSYEAHAEFSPDGRQIMFHRQVGQKSDDGRYDFDIYSLDLETRVLTLLVQSPFEESYGSWSADGTHFVFSSDMEEDPEKHNLYVMAVGSVHRKKLTDGDWNDSYAYWTRDGKYIYFNSDRTGITQVYRLSMDGPNCKSGH